MTPAANPPISAVHRDIYSMLAAQAETRPGATAIQVEGRPDLSYATLFRMVNGMVASLRQAGVTRQDRVAIVLPNGRDMATALLGVSCAAIAAPFNPSYLEDEYESYFRAVRASYLLIQEGVTCAATRVALKLGLQILEVSVDEESNAYIREEDSPKAAPSPSAATSGHQPPEPQDIALILLTSGSTGRPKKVPLTHRNICASVGDICCKLLLTPEDVCLSMWEQFHIGGLVDLLLVPLASGGTVICTPGFNAELFYELLESRRPTWFQGVPATEYELLAHARRVGMHDIRSSLRLIRSVASALSPQLMQEIEDFFHVPVVQTFGMTEAAPLITTNPLPPGIRKTGSVGPTCGPEVAIMDPAGNFLKPGEVGEVVVRGDNVMSGYEDEPEANAHSFRYGWFHTGDTGFLDEDGYLFLRGRIKEMINRGGEKISPQEIDDVLLTHPAIAEAISFSIPHKILGENVAVAVLLRTPNSLTENDVRQYVAEHLIDFKIPQQVIFVDDFPRGPSGKVNRIALAETLGLNTESNYVAPRTDLERTLAKIWAEELEIKRVGIEDNFFALGGDSLSGARLIVAVETKLAKPLPTKALFKLSTVTEMAAAIEADNAAPKTTTNAPQIALEPVLSEANYRMMLSVVAGGKIPAVKPGSLLKRMNENGKRTPLFWCFNKPDKNMHTLGTALGPDQPLYGLFSGASQLPGSDRSERIIASIAHHYAREILELQLEGPVALGGNCRGARIAMKLAVRLQQLGKSVSHLILLENFDPGAFGYTGKMLLMYGKQSKHFAYRRFRWGKMGWKVPFRSVPDVRWVPGIHGEFLRPDNVGDVTQTIRDFLDDKLKPPTIAERLSTHGLLLIHKSSTLFNLYARATAGKDTHAVMDLDN
jgi:acyl-CoA synthetase (AMP-forming)/AMP-acid ligase II/thioesterase domain-containing protein/acyl carrier protein